MTNNKHDKTTYIGDPIDIDARAAVSTYVVFTVIFMPLIVCLLLYLIAEKPHDVDGWKILGTLVITYIIFVTWIRAFHIKTNDGQLSYKSLFGGLTIVKISKIKSAKIVVGDYLDGRMFKPFIRLELKYKQNGDAVKGIDINMKVFKLEDIHLLISFLENNGVAVK